jgi:2'-5' RNA ligase
MRLFFALWPDREAADKLAGAARALAELSGGKPVPRDKIHLTLAFLGERDDADLARAVEVARPIAAQPVRITLDEVGSFRGARVAWAGCGRVAPELASLQSALEGALRGRGFELEARPFVAHVTLARRITRNVPRAPLPPVAWEAREFTLVRTQPGTGGYSILERWVIRSRPTPG